MTAETQQNVTAPPHLPAALDHVRDNRLIRPGEVYKRVGFAASTVARWVKDGSFPQPVKINGSRDNRWWLSDILEWLAQYKDVPADNTPSD